MAKQLERLKEAGMHWAVIIPFAGAETVLAAFYIKSAAEHYMSVAEIDGARIVEL